MTTYIYFSNGIVEFSLLKSATPKEYHQFDSPIFCDFDSENLRFIIDFWRNDCMPCCTEQQLYDLVRIKMDVVEEKVKPVKITVGHRIFTTTKETLSKMPYFEAAFRMGGDFKQNLDRDAVYFERLLSHCRHPLQHPLYSLNVSVQEISFFGLCPKNLQIWNAVESGENDSRRVPLEIPKEGYKNSMSLALNARPDITMFINNYRRFTEFNLNTLFLDESLREAAPTDGLGDTVFFTSESIDCSLIDVMTNFHVVCESDVEICSVNQLFENIYATLYACNKDDDPTVERGGTFRRNIEIKPVKSRHATILHSWQMVGSEREAIYFDKQSRHEYDTHDDTVDLADATTSDKLPGFVGKTDHKFNMANSLIDGCDVSKLAVTPYLGKELTVSMSHHLHRFLAELKQQSPFMSVKKGNRYYLTVPLHLFFTAGICQNSQFFTMRNKFHFQLRFDGVKIQKLRLMLNACQMSEEEYDATIMRQSEFLTEIQYSLFCDECPEGKLHKSWIFAKPYSIRYFFIQICDSDSGERLACNVKGKIVIGEDVMPFNIHTNMVTQKNVLLMSQYNPYLYIVPYCIRSGLQPTGCCFVVTDTPITIDIECDANSVDIYCWMSCYRVLQQDFEEEYEYEDKRIAARNAIGFMQDVDVKPIPYWTNTQPTRRRNRCERSDTPTPIFPTYQQTTADEETIQNYASSLQDTIWQDYFVERSEDAEQENVPVCVWQQQYSTLDTTVAESSLDFFEHAITDEQTTDDTVATVENDKNKLNDEQEKI